MRMGATIAMLTLGALLAACGSEKRGSEDVPPLGCTTHEECDDGDHCTIDSCDEETGECEYGRYLNPRYDEGPYGALNCGDGVDNDCDFLTDGEDDDCQPECATDEDCADADPCTLDSCSESLCSHDPAEDGTACDDGLYCTVDEVCLAGSCSGNERDCSHLDSECAVGVCREQLQECGIEVAQQNVPCEFADYCSSAGTCRNGVCEGNNDRDVDGDGWVDAACPPGNDCDDEDAAVHPNTIEGPPWGSKCNDGLDNDCNEQIDGEDFSCQAGPGLCNARGWCYENPTPQGNHLMGAWANSADDIWVVGDSNTVLHWDGTGWYRASGMIGSTRHDVWASGPDDVWSVLRGNVSRWDGESWRTTSVSNRDFYAIWGSSPADVWAGGQYYANEATLYHYDGIDWEERNLSSGGSLGDLWGFAANDVWAVGGGGRIWHFDGTNWSLYQTSNGEYLSGIWGSSPDDVWAVGDDETVVRYNGSGWTLDTNAPLSAANLHVVWGSAPDDVWVAGTRGGEQNYLFHWDGLAWSEPYHLTQWIAAGVALSATEHLAVGQRGLMLRWNGSDWTEVSRDVVGGWKYLFGGCSPGASDEAWAVGTEGLAIRRDPASGTWEIIESGTNELLRGVWCSNAGGVWAVGSNGTILSWDEMAGSWSPMASGTDADLYAVWMTSTGDEGWAVGSGGTALRYSAGAWTSVSSGTVQGLKDVRGSGPDDVWAVGDGGTILHWSGGGWTRVTSPATGFLYAVFVLDADHVWAGGGDGVLLRYDPGAGSFESVEVGTDEIIKAIWALDPGDVWIAAYDEIWHDGGEGWYMDREDEFKDHIALWGNQQGAIWTVSSLGGRIMRRVP